MSGRRVLVTGASGFVGRDLVPRLARAGWRVRALARHWPQQPAEGVEPVVGDIARGLDWAPLVAGCDAVVHAAGIAHTSGIEAAAYEQVNTRATLELAEAARGRVERFVFLSSIRAQCGASAPGVLTEESPPSPSDAYGISKLRAEEGLARMDGLGLSVLRPTLVVGEEAKGNLSTLLALARLPGPLPFAGLRARRSLVARSDLCEAVRRGIDPGQAALGTVIICDPQPLSVARMIASMREGLGRRPMLFPVPDALIGLALTCLGRGADRDRLFGDLVASPAKLISLGWTPREPAAEALRAFAAARRERRIPEPPRP